MKNQSNENVVVVCNEIDVKNVVVVESIAMLTTLSMFVVAFAISYLNEIVATSILFATLLKFASLTILSIFAIAKNSLTRNRRRVNSRLNEYVERVESTFIDAVQS